MLRIGRNNDFFSAGRSDEYGIFRKERSIDDDFFSLFLNQCMKSDGQGRRSAAGHVEIAALYIGSVSLIHEIGKARTDGRITGCCGIAVDFKRSLRLFHIDDRFRHTVRSRYRRISDGKIKYVVLPHNLCLFLAIIEKVADDRTIGT